MKKDLSGKALGIIHAAVFTAGTLAPFAAEILPEVEIMHLGDDTVQRDNLRSPVGVIPKVNYFKFTTYARFLQDAGVDMILLACSTFNKAAELASPMIDIPILQIDRPMMEKAVDTGKRIGLIGTLPSTMPSSERLLYQCAADAGKPIEIVSVLNDDAFTILRAGDAKKHNAMLMEDIACIAPEVDCIVLAQASMSALDDQLQAMSVPVYTSPRLGFERVRAMLEKAD